MTSPATDFFISFLGKVSMWSMSIHKAQIAAIMASFLLVAQAHALGYERGPTPTEVALNASSGPYALQTTSIPGGADFGSLTIYYPSTKADGKFGLVVLCPGIGAIKDYYTWLSKRVASHGFVVVAMNADNISDFDAARSKQMIAALDAVAAKSKQLSSLLYDRVDDTRRAVMGHSMGGGGALNAGRDNPDLKASVAIAPGGVNTTIVGLNRTQVPTLIMGFSSDVIVSPTIFAEPYFSSLPNTLNAAYLLSTGDHFSATTIGSARAHDIIARAGVSWLKRFVDNDRRYDKFVQKIDGTGVIRYKTQGPNF